jgi:hypothetical protein
LGATLDRATAPAKTDAPPAPGPARRDLLDLETLPAADLVR